MKNKKVLIGVIIFCLVFIIGIISFIIINSKKTEEEAKKVLISFVDLLNDKNYNEMYNYISQTSKDNITQEEFVERNTNIYQGIDAVDVKIYISNIEKNSNYYKIAYNQKMYTSAGDINFTSTVDIIKENNDYKIHWNSSFIFPELDDKDKVRVSTIKSTRGEILDRNNNKLAKNGKIAQVGIVPGKLGEDKEENISKISHLTGVSSEYINKQLSASYVKDDIFVPIKKIQDSNIQLKEDLLEISGILINKIDGREYPYGKQIGHLIGYVQSINSEELEKNENKGYNTNSIIGKSGLEKSYEDTLRGIDGTQIYIVDELGNTKTVLAKQDKKDGNDIKLTIDINVQCKLYEQIKDDKGLFVVMQPKTGELLSLISTPTFDSNDFVVGMTTQEWDKLNNDVNKPLFNRFLQKYCPGSTFKPITGAIGLSSGKINASEDYGYTGTSWQKDNSWGNYKITTLTAYNGQKNLLNAMIHSDNIYFAKSALRIGADIFTEYLDKLGFNEQIDFPLSLAKSQYSNNDNKIEGETKLADTGYGQGSILVNPIHMASIYSCFVNDGNMIKPILEYNEQKAQILKENVFSKEAANTIKQSLIQVIENPEGTANDMKITDMTIAGKTGTAELKNSSEDTQSGTLGWFNCFTVDNETDMLVIGMVENTQNNSEGGSHYVIKKIKSLFNNM